MTVSQSLKEAVKSLDDATNEMTIGPSEIAEAFQDMHPYLLNQLILGLLKVCSHPMRQGDDRILKQIQELAMELW